MCFLNCNFNISIEKISVMAGRRRIQEFSFHSDLIFLKNFIMIATQHSKSLPNWFCFAMLILLACNGTNNGQQKTSNSTTSTDHQHADTLLSDNEVKAEAPDAN